MISFVIVANSDWYDFATPYVKSIRKHEPKVEIVLVDNGSKKPYEKIKDYQLVRLETERDYNYMKALNSGARHTSGDWIVFSNDDVLCCGKFVDRIVGLPQKCLYGMEIREKPANWGLGVGFKYVYGWLLIMHRAVWDEIGEFDEYYLHAGFDDIDYSWRCQRAGIPLKTVPLPFLHLADSPRGYHRRVEVDGYRENMYRSKMYFLEKVKNDIYEL